jgi:phenylalanyl-tRNA synthetase alpha chain
VAEIRENEMKTLLALEKLGGRGAIGDIIKISKLEDAAVMRAALSLSGKKLVTIHERKETYIKLNEEGTSYVKIGLPERRLIKVVIALGGVAAVKDASEKSNVSAEMLPIALGWVKRKGWANIKKRDGELILEVSREADEGPDEKLLRYIHERGEAKKEELNEEMREVLLTLKSRNLIEATDKVHRELELTSEGWDTVKRGVEVIEEVSALTTELITSGKWRSLKLREYDVAAAPPTIYPGKEHIYVKFMEDARRILLAMGFEEAEGPLVETEFWNFDVLFQAQDHPAREIHDSYILKYPALGALEFPELVEKVRKTHENGWTTGSVGWKYKWDLNIARRLVLRTQTTAVSMRYLATHKKPPIKMFCLSKVFRPDVLDAKHSMEFIQLEGIVGDVNITLRHLLGFLRGFAEMLGLGEVKFKPGYFPFTEPSVESFVKHPTLGWIEFAGAGIFRPEVLKPLGVDFPVIAWGIGLDRLAMASLNINDIRELYSKRLDWLREKTLR